jgi:hypothetical protein
MEIVSQSKTRRRIETDTQSESRIGRGCLIWGGVLGIVVGAAFAFYGLKPILKHFYGESTVAAHAAYHGDGKQLAVAGTGASAKPGNVPCLPTGTDPAEIFCLAFSITSGKDPGFKASDFSLEVTNQHDWIHATSLVGPDVEPPAYSANSPVILSIHFPATIGGDSVDPEYLHLTSPRVRFAIK